jgi:hypothetical protein
MKATNPTKKSFLTHPVQEEFQHRERRRENVTPGEVSVWESDAADSGTSI